MPCRDERSDLVVTRYAHEEMKNRLDLATRLLCELCTKLEKLGLVHLLTSEMSTWWDDHKKQDAVRVARGG